MNLKVSRVACFPSAMFNSMERIGGRQDLIMDVFQPSKFNATKASRRAKEIYKGVILIIDYGQNILDLVLKMWTQGCL